MKVEATGGVEELSDKRRTESPITRERFTTLVADALGADMDVVNKRYDQHRATAFGMEKTGNSPINQLQCDGQETARSVDYVRKIHGDDWFKHWADEFSSKLREMADNLEREKNWVDTRELLTVWAATFVWPFTAEDAWVELQNADRSSTREDIHEGVDCSVEMVSMDVKPWSDTKRADYSGYIKADVLVCYAVDTETDEMVFGIERVDGDDDAAYIKARDRATPEDISRGEAEDRLRNR